MNTSLQSDQRMYGTKMALIWLYLVFFAALHLIGLQGWNFSVSTNVSVEARISPRQFWSESRIMNYQTSVSRKKEVPQNLLIVEHVE